MMKMVDSCDMLITLDGCDVVGQEGGATTLVVRGLRPMSGETIDQLREELMVVCGHAALPSGFANDLLDRLVDLSLAHAVAQRIVKPRD